MLPDVNILVAAHRQDHPHHGTAQKWLRSALSNVSAQPLSLAMPVVSGFLRLVTNSKIFRVPTTSVLAIDFIDWLIEDPRVRWVESAKEWPHFRALVMDQSLAANLIPDAQLAALAQHLGEPLVTFDQGFKKLLPRSLLTLLSGQ